MENFSLRMQRPLLNPNKVIPDEVISFDFDGKIFYLKAHDQDSCFEYLNKDFSKGEKFIFSDYPGTQYFGIYVTYRGRYLLDLACCKLYETKQEFADSKEVDQFVKDNLKNEFVADFPQKALFERFGGDYESFRAVCEKVVQKDEEDYKNANVCQPQDDEVL